jgi:hypothetical protein
MRTLILFTSLLFVAILGVPTFHAQEKREEGYLKTSGGPPALRQELILREEQEGVGGASIKAWTLTPAGKWAVVQTLLNLQGKVKSNSPRTLRQGDLSEGQVLQLAEVLRSQRFVDLPTTMGTKPVVNSHVYSLEFGKKTATLHGTPPLHKGSLLDHITTWGPKDSEKEVKQFGTIAQRIFDICQPKDVPVGARP